MSLTARHRSFVFVFALALALWLASTLGLVHRTLHGSGATRVLVASFAVAPSVAVQTGFANSTVAAADTAATASPGFISAPALDGFTGRGLAGLFSVHSDGECRLYDQLSHGAPAPCVPLVMLPMLLPAATFAYLEGEALARWVLLLRARGPPFTR